MENDEIVEEYSIEELLQELKIRNQNLRLKKMPSNNNRLKSFSSEHILKIIKKKEEYAYGSSLNKDFFEISNQQILDDADSVVSIFESSSIQDNKDNTSSLLTTEFGESYDLCQSEKYRKQPIGAFCSGVLVGLDIIATTGHGINSSNLLDTRFIFGFKIKDINETNIVINNFDIYKGKRIINRKLTDDGPDYALVQLDRKVMNHNVAIIRTDGKISANTKVHVIGHPCGLPLKLGYDSIIKDNSNDSYFVTNLDTYGGNSGSPVFNSDTHKVEGILVRGETNFISIGNCNKSLICPTTGCRGLDCTRTTTFSHLL